VKAVVIPDLQSCDAKVPLLGVVSVCVCDMVIVRLCLPPIGHGPRLTLTEAGLFQLKAQKIDVKVSFHWSWHQKRHPHHHHAGEGLFLVACISDMFAARNALDGLVDLTWPVQGGKGNRIHYGHTLVWHGLTPTYPDVPDVQPNHMIIAASQHVLNGSEVVWSLPFLKVFIHTGEHFDMLRKKSAGVQVSCACKSHSSPPSPNPSFIPQITSFKMEIMHCGRILVGFVDQQPCKPPCEPKQRRHFLPKMIPPVLARLQSRHQTGVSNPILTHTPRSVMPHK